MLGAVADPNIGREIANQFRIVEKIGTGGMGAVYKAEQPEMRRFVAIKILHPRYLSRPDLVSRFRREARAMSHLSHPNTVKVFLYGQLEDGSCYFVMEYLEGRNLAQTVRAEGPMDPERAIPIMVQVCGALEEAHAKGIIHRDLKPENIFLTNVGGIPDFPKVLDFGLAKVTDREMRPGSLILTQEGMVFGTPEFMSPEQARGEKLDGRSDIYALGLILYELLTGKLPYDASQPMEYLQRHLKEPPIPLHLRAPHRTFPPGLWEVIQKALAKHPAQRFQTAGEFAQALQAVIDRNQRLLPAPLLPVWDMVSVSNRIVPNESGSPPTPPFAEPAAASPAQPTPAGHATADHPTAPAAPRAHAEGAGASERAPSHSIHPMDKEPNSLAGSKAPWIMLGLGTLLALLGTAALVLAILLRR